MAQDFSSHAAHAQALNRFIDGSPSPFHAVASATAMLDSAGFRALASSDSPGGPGRFYSARDP